MVYRTQRLGVVGVLSRVLGFAQAARGMIDAWASEGVQGDSQYMCSDDNRYRKANRSDTSVVLRIEHVPVVHVIGWLVAGTNRYDSTSQEESQIKTRN